MAMAGLGVIGVIGGWVAAVAVILCAAIVWVGLPGKAGGEKLPVKPLVKYFIGVALYLTLFNALLFVDSILIKRFTTIYFDEHATQLAASLDTIPWAKRVTGFKFDASVLADVQNAY